MIWRTRSGAMGLLGETANELARLAPSFDLGTDCFFGDAAAGDFEDVSCLSFCLTFCLSCAIARADLALFNVSSFLMRRAPSCRPLRLGWRGEFPRGIVPPRSQIVIHGNKGAGPGHSRDTAESNCAAIDVS